jgi:Fe-S cluster biogenesis protein NfuA
VGREVVARLATDHLVSALLVLHGLHPQGVAARVHEALDRVRPLLGAHGGGVTLLAVDGVVARVRLEGACGGCASSGVTLRALVERAIAEGAPEVTSVEVVEADKTDVVQLRRRA